MNIAQNIERASRFFPDKAAVIFEGQTTTYRQLNKQANRVANALNVAGIETGDRVALYLPNIPAFAAAYLGTVKRGAIAVSLNAMLKAEEVKYIINDCGAKWIFTTGELLPNLPLDETPTLEQVIVCEGETGGRPALDEWLAPASASARAADLARDAPAAILYTSGTTGFPKGATLSHGNVVSNLYATNHHTGMRPDDRLMLFLPLFHCFGQNFIMNAAFNTGTTVVLHRRFVPDEVLDSIQRHQATMFFAVPTIYIHFLNAGIPPEALASLRYYFTAAANMPPEIARRWQETFSQPIYEGYGLTECSPFACYNHDFRYKPGSVGQPIENVEVKILDQDGQEMPAGEWGEICIKGPNVMLGYWNKPEATAAAIQDGWLRSGDIGLVDDEGYVSIVDRTKDMINVSGFKVYPAEVEHVLYRHPAVHEAAVFGVTDEVKGERVRAHVVLKPGQTVTSDEMIAFCREQIATYKVPAEITFVAALPKSATGKVLKRLMRDT